MFCSVLKRPDIPPFFKRDIRLPLTFFSTAFRFYARPYYAAEYTLHPYLASHHLCIGSTGAPKGVVVTHRNVVNCVLSYLYQLDLGFTGTLLIYCNGANTTPPMYHAHSRHCPFKCTIKNLKKRNTGIYLFD